MSNCIYFETDAGLFEDTPPEEAEDSDFWERVTKPESSKTPDSQQVSRV